MLHIKNLKKQYKSFVLDCSLDVPAGRIVGLIGQNGAGKSTTFKAALGLIRTDSGSIRICGKTISDFNEQDRQSIGVVLSDSGFSGYLTVKDLIPILAALYKDFDGDDFRARLEKFKLPLDKKIKEFSTGMKAKLKVLVAMSHGARLLILDEPTSGLDVVARDELLLTLREFMESDEERAILISSHISSDLESLCDDIYMIDGGKIILHEDTDVLLGSYAIIKASNSQYSSLDKKHLLSVREEPWGISALTAQRQYYIDNYPALTVEKASIDGIISMMIRGEAQ